jgi:hypothetical protein
MKQLRHGSRTSAGGVPRRLAGVALGLAFLAPAAVQAGSSYRWTQVTDSAAYTPRDGAGAAVLNDQMWLLGGWNPAAYPPYSTTNEIWRSTDGASWTFVNYAPWEGRHTFGNAILDEKIWVLGGDPLRGHYQPDVWYSSDGVDWTQATAAAPWGERCLQCAAVHDGRIWVMGGETMTQFVPSGPPDEHYNDLWCSTDGANWTRVTEHADWSPRGMIGGSVELNGRMWLLGGGTYSPRSYFNDVWSSADGVTWRRDLAAAPWAPRQYHDVAVFDDKMWVLEGFNGDLGGNRNDVWYSPDGVIWTELPDTPWAPRHAASVFVFDNALWMVAGNNMEKDVWRLDVVPSEPTGDLDRDGNVDLHDFALLSDCLTGPTVLAEPECDPADFDADADLDLCDFSRFQQVFSGRSGMLYAPTNPDNPAWRAAVAAYTGQRCDYFDARTGTPSVEMMDEYHCVFTWVNYAYDDNVAMGDNLAAYVDRGGKVLLGQWCLPTAGIYLSGRIMSTGYIPVTGASYSPGSYAGDGVDCVHVLGPVSSYACNYRDQCTLLPGNLSDGTFTDGWLAVAWRPNRGVYYSPGNTGADFTAGDTAELVGNMCACGD